MSTETATFDVGNATKKYIGDDDVHGGEEEDGSEASEHSSYEINACSPLQAGFEFSPS